MEDINEIGGFEDDEILLTPKKKKIKKQKDIFILIKTQIVVCIVAVLAAFIIKFIGGDIYRLTRDKYISMFNDYTSVNEVMQTVAEVFDIKTESNGGESSTSASDVSDTTSDTIPANATDVSAEEGSSAVSQDASQGGDEEESGNYTMSLEESKALMTANAEAINTMQLPLPGRISDEYGYRIHPLSGQLKMHYGIDIAAPHGSDIGAAMSGKVIKTGNSSDLGIYIKLSHGGGLETLYAHCSETVSNVGDVVTKGQTIAKVGSTGVSTGAHCHFEVRINGTRINPMWIAKVQST